MQRHSVEALGRPHNLLNSLDRGVLSTDSHYYIEDEALDAAKHISDQPAWKHFDLHTCTEIIKHAHNLTSLSHSAVLQGLKEPSEE